MQVIFSKTVPKVANKGDLKNVSDGYFRNFLKPNNLAFIATPTLIDEAKKREKERMLKKDEIKAKALEIKDKLEGKKVEMQAKVSAKDKLYASIHEKDVALVLKEKYNYEFDPSSIKFPEAIKKTGEYKVKIELSSSVSVTIVLIVIAKN